MDKRTSYSEIFKKYVPIEFASMLADLLIGTNVKFKVVRGRKTKLGDFRYGSDLPKPIITVNGDLNPYAFLITALHEFAHYHTYLNYNNRVQPHGEEWKYSFQILMVPFIRPEIFPSHLLPLLARHFKNPTASSDTDATLSLALKQFDEQNDKNYIFEIPYGSVFRISNGKIFKKIAQRVKRFECVEINSGRTYLFNPNAEVELLNS